MDESWLRAAVAVLALAGAACGGSSPSAPSTPSPGPGGGGGGPSLITATVQPNGLNVHEAGPLANDGVLTAVLTWSNTAVDLDLYLTAPDCNAYPPTNCTILARSDGTGTTSERLARGARRGERYRLWVDNFDRNRSETYQLQVLLNSTASTTDLSLEAPSETLDLREGRPGPVSGKGPKR